MATVMVRLMRMVNTWFPQREVLKFPDVFLTNVKFFCPTELTISQISPDNGLYAELPSQPDPLHPFIYAFSRLRAMYMNR